MVTNSMGRTLCVADIAPTITPDGNSVNRTAFDELYSASDFDNKQKAKMLNRYKKCAIRAQVYTVENGDALWNNWQENQPG